MTIALSFLRGINVGGHKTIKMADLRALYTALGFRKTRTLLQSGNAIFETSERDLTLIQCRIEAGIRQRFGFDVDVILRSASAFSAALERHPFSAEQLDKPKQAMLVFLSGAPDPAALQALRANNPGREVIQAAEDTLYIFYTDGVARSKLDNKRIERALAVTSTARNWNTCQRLQRLLAADG